MARNPFRSEAEAYRFLLLTVGYVALIVVAAAIATWLGLVVFVVLSALVVFLWARSRSNEPALRPAVPTFFSQVVTAFAALGSTSCADAHAGRHAAPKSSMKTTGAVKSRAGARRSTLIVSPSWAALVTLGNPVLRL